MRGSDDWNLATQIEAFRVLSNETRLRIISVLAADRRVDWQYAGRSFAELRKSVGIRDAGTFTYHLDQLQDRFVIKDGEEYILTDAGLEVADMLAAGTLDPTRLDPERVAKSETPCPSCDERLRVRYENSRCAVRCPEHGEFIVNSVPPAAVADRDGEAVLRFVLRDIHQELEDARDGVCFHCSGRMHASVQTDTPIRNPVTGDPPGEDARDVTIGTAMTSYGCQRCETVFWSDPRWLVLRHPAVVALLYPAEVRHYSFLDPTIREAAAEPEVHTTDPLRVLLPFDHEEETVTLVVDDAMNVVESRF